MVAKTRRIARGESRGRRRKERAPRHSATAEAPRPWSIERRLSLIEERLFWIGEVNRNDLVQRFGVSMSQASADIARYLALRPRGVRYDKSVKRYVADENFRPVLTSPDAARLLGQLRLVDAGLLAAADTSLGEAPPVAATPVPERAVDPFVLRALLQAIRGRTAVSVRYQSMSRPEPLRRVLEPHALAYDGFRWHARAHDRESGEFRDFVIGRISAPRAAGPALVKPANDAEWQSWIALRIAPHPGLTAAQARAVAHDYGIRGASTPIRVRRSLLYYALKRLGLDVPPGTRPPHEQHIVLVNRVEIESLIKRPERTSEI